MLQSQSTRSIGESLLLEDSRGIRYDDLLFAPVAQVDRAGHAHFGTIVWQSLFCLEMKQVPFIDFQVKASMYRNKAEINISGSTLHLYCAIPPSKAFPFPKEIAFFYEHQRV